MTVELALRANPESGGSTDAQALGRMDERPFVNAANAGLAVRPRGPRRR